jgi:5-methylcytosine-specific restriction endonuclease McrA
MMARLPEDRYTRLLQRFGADLSGLSDYKLFDAIAKRAGLLHLNLSHNQKLTVLRRLGGGKKWTGLTFEQAVIGVLTRDQKAYLQRRDHENLKRQAALLRERLADSVLLAPSAIAAQSEHLTVLAGLPASHFYRTAEWLSSRADALRLSGYRCEWCGADRKKAFLHVDHVVPRIAAPERAFDLSNLRVLCEPCHIGRHASERSA